MLDLTSANHVSQHLDRVGLVVGLVFGWCLNDGDVFAQIPANVLIKECYRCQIAVAMELLVFFSPIFKIKGLYRFTKSICQHAVDGVEHFFARGVDLGFAGLFMNQLTQNYGIMTQLIVQNSIDFV